MLKKFAFLILCSLVISNLDIFSQNQEIFNHSVFWSKTEVNEIFFEEGKQEAWGAGLDFVYRRKNEMGEGSMFDARLRESIRPWVHYQFSPYVRLSVSPIGMMFTDDYKGKESDFNRLPYRELRSTIQLFHHIKQLDDKIMHTWRYRWEFRNQENANTEEWRFFQRFRIRYRLRWVFDGDNFYENNMWYLAGSSELGINVGNNVTYKFNQNRIYLGIGHRFFNAARLELRYLDRFRVRGGSGFEYDHGRGIMLGIYIDQITGLGLYDIQPVRASD